MTKPAGPRAPRPRKTLRRRKPLQPARSFDSARPQARCAQDDKAGGADGHICPSALDRRFSQVEGLFRSSRCTRAGPRASRPGRTLRRRKPLPPARSFDCGRFAPFAQDDNPAGASCPALRMTKPARPPLGTTKPTGPMGIPALGSKFAPRAEGAHRRAPLRSSCGAARKMRSLHPPHARPTRKGPRQLGAAPRSSAPDMPKARSP